MNELERVLALERLVTDLEQRAARILLTGSVLQVVYKEDGVEIANKWTDPGAEILYEQVQTLLVERRTQLEILRRQVLDRK